MRTELSFDFLKEKQKVNIKIFIIPTIVFLFCFMFWLLLVIGGVPLVGVSLCFVIFVLNPIIIIVSLMKLEIGNLKRNAKLLDNGLYISKMILKRIESDTSVDDITYYYFKLISKEKKENASKLTHEVSYKEYKNALIGSMYYVIHLRDEDEFGEKYIVEGVYSSKQYDLSTELMPFLIDYNQIDDANKKRAKHVV